MQPHPRDDNLALEFDALDQCVLDTEHAPQYTCSTHVALHGSEIWTFNSPNPRLGATCVPSSAQNGFTHVAGDPNFEGAIDDVQFWSSMLSPAEVRTVATGRIHDFSAGTWDWTQPTADAAGVCLRAVSGGAITDGGTWTPDTDDANCEDDDDPWRAIPATAQVVARTPPFHASAFAHMRFGMRTSANTPPGAYRTPITFTTVAPDL